MPWPGSAVVRCSPTGVRPCSIRPWRSKFFIPAPVASEIRLVPQARATPVDTVCVSRAQPRRGALGLTIACLAAGALPTVSFAQTQLPVLPVPLGPVGQVAPRVGPDVAEIVSPGAVTAPTGTPPALLAPAPSPATPAIDGPHKDHSFSEPANGPETRLGVKGRPRRSRAPRSGSATGAARRRGHLATATRRRATASQAALPDRLIAADPAPGGPGARLR